MEKTRDEIKEEYKWDLSSVYKSNDELLCDFNEMSKKVDEFKKCEDTFLNSADNLYNTLKEYYSISIILDKMYTFTSHRYDTDLSNNENQMWRDKVYNLIEKFYSVSSFITPKLLEFTFDNVKKYYKECPKLEEEYGFDLEKTFRYEAHTLSLEEEKLMASLSKAMSDTGEISSMLSDSDLIFGEITDSEGNKVRITDTNYSVYSRSTDRRVRKEAFSALYQTYKQFNNTYALLLSGENEKKKALAKAEKYNSALEAALFSDNVSTKVYTNLIDTVKKNLSPLYEYYKLKQKILGLDEMHLYDTYAPISSDNKKYTFEEAKNLVINALSILGEDYVTNLKKAFDERWIDIYPNKSKRGGAYSGGCYLTHPFVLTNFNGNYTDVSTLAHELGHSMHSYYSVKNNPYQYSQYKIFVAEVASQVNELLLNDYMLKCAKTKEEKINILNQTLELFKASIYRQTMFAEFEKDISDMCEKGEILTAEKLNDTYYNLVKTYFGKDVVCDEYIKYEWQRIPHFYYNFYVYKYSCGLSAAAYIAKSIINKEENALENYLSFLKTGGSMYPLDELSIAGVDLEDEKTITYALDMFKDYLDKLKKLIS